jgi:hypothetical protein
VNRVRAKLFEKFVCLGLQGKWPNIPQGFVLDHSVALDAVNCHHLAIMDFREGTKALVVSWGDHVNLIT